MDAARWNVRTVSGGRITRGPELAEEATAPVAPPTTAPIAAPAPPPAIPPIVAPIAAPPTMLPAEYPPLPGPFPTQTSLVSGYARLSNSMEFSASERDEFPP